MNVTPAKPTPAGAASLRWSKSCWSDRPKDNRCKASHSFEHWLCVGVAESVQLPGNLRLDPEFLVQEPAHSIEHAEHELKGLDMMLVEHQ